MGSRDQDDVRIGGVRPAETAKPADAASEAASAASTPAVSGATEVRASVATEAIVAALASGAVGSAAAQAQLIDCAVRAQLPAHADAQLVEDLRDEVEALLASDPTLAALLR